MTDNDSDSTDGSPDSGGDSLLKVIYSFWNLNLLRDAGEGLQSIDSYVVSITVFHVGVLTLATWSVIVALSLFVGRLASTGGPLGILEVVFQWGPVIPLWLFIFAYVARWAFKRLQASSPPDSKWSTRSRRVAVGATTVVAIVVAAATRVAIFNVLGQVYGDSLSTTEVIGTMIVDVGYLSLLLIGIGGFASLATEPEAE